MTRYTLIRGGSDRAGGWYLVDADGDIIDSRGPGFATRADALDALLERLSGAPWEPGPDLVSIAAIAQRADVDRQTVYAWRRRHPAFPEPLIDLGPGLRRWDWAEVAEWLAAPRRSGRPARA